MYQKLLKDIPGQVYTLPQLGTYYYAFNTQKGRLPIHACVWRSA
jgi:oligopeptide transport system substrate-binding protein